MQWDFQMEAKIGGSKLIDNIHPLQRWIASHNPGPLVVEVSASYGCNHNCMHCGFQQLSPYSRKRHFLDPAVFKKFLCDFKTLGGLEIYFAGNGEPLLNRSLPEWIKYGKEIGLNMTVSTNGVLLGKTKIRSILPYVKWIRFSVNGGDRETYVKAHRCHEQDFDKLVRNLESAVKYRNYNELTTNLIIQFLIYELNWKSIRGILDIHKRIGTDLLIFRNVAVEDGKKSDQIRYIMDRLKEMEGEEKVEIRWDTFKEMDDELTWDKCYGINFRTNMDDKGNLFTCYRHLYKNSIYGNIHNKSFIEIWQSSYKRELFSIIEQGREIPICKKWCQAIYDNLFIRDHLNALSKEEEKGNEKN